MLDALRLSGLQRATARLIDGVDIKVHWGAPVRTGAHACTVPYCAVRR
jgi:hypothetical protein